MNIVRCPYSPVIKKFTFAIIIIIIITMTMFMVLSRDNLVLIDCPWVLSS